MKTRHLIRIKQLIFIAIACKFFYILLWRLPYKVRQRSNLTEQPASQSPRLVLYDFHGDVVLNKNIGKYWNEPLRLWNCSTQLLTLIHISKTGGTSFLKSLRNSLYNNPNCTICRLQCVQTRITEYNKKDCLLPAYCSRHFDWTLLKKAEQDGLQLAPLVRLRDPVTRFISNFYYAKTRDVWWNTKMINQSLSEYLNDHESMMETRYLWHDGQGAVSWLAGTHIYNIVTRSLSKLELASRERHAMDWSYMLDRTIDNLHKCLWVGVFEDTDKGLEMLKYQTGFGIQLMRLNVNKVRYPELTQDDINKIKSLMPMDIYIYEYVKQLHNHRWNMYQKQKISGLEVDQNFMFNLPSIIQGCKSSRYILKCPNFTYLYEGTAQNVAVVAD